VDDMTEELKVKKRSNENKLEILAACIDILNDEVQKTKKGESANDSSE